MSLFFIFSQKMDRVERDKAKRVHHWLSLQEENQHDAAAADAAAAAAAAPNSPLLLHS